MKRLTSSTALRISFLTVSSIAALLAVNLYFATSAASRREAITLRGNSSLNFHSGRIVSARYKAAGVSAGIETALKQGQAQALSLATDDINQDGFPDVVGGYANADAGLLALHFGNPEAFSPTRPETLQALTKGRFADPFLPDAAVLAVPAAPDWLTTGDFNRDGRLDILTGTRGGSALYLLAGDENHGFAPAQTLALPGSLTALAVAPKSEVGGSLSVAVALDGQEGASLLVYDAQHDLFAQQPRARAVPAAVTALATGRLDEDRSTDVAIIAGGQLYLLHGQADKAASSLVRPDKQAGQLEPIALPFGVQAVAVSDYIWDRDARLELAVASQDGTVHLLVRGTLDTRPLTASEVLERRQLIEQARRGQRRWTDLATPPTEQAMNWMVAETTALNIAKANDGAQSLLMSTLASGQQAHDLLVLNQSAKQLQIAFKAKAQAGRKEVAGRETITFDTGDEPMAALPVRLNVLGRPGLVVLRRGQVAPAFVMLAPTATHTVNHASDTDDASPGDNNCADSSGNCSLRAAMQETNAATGADMITFAASLNGTPLQLTQTGDDNSADNGDLDINDSVTIVGNGAANTILQGSANAGFGSNVGDKIFGINQDGISSTLNVSISGLTIRFSKNANPVGTFTETGGALDVFLTGTGASPGPTVTVTNCTFDGNANQNSYGGAVNIDSGDLLGGTNIFRGTVQFTGCTISNNKTLDAGVSAQGGGVNLFGDKHDVSFTNCTITGNQTSGNIGSNGGGINLRHSFGGTIALNGTTVSNNTAGSDGGGIMIAGIGGATVTVTGGSISGNTAQGTGDSGDGGGLFNGNPSGSTTLSGVTISNNLASAGPNGRGGGIADGATSPLTINNCTISGNQADSGGGVATISSGGTQTTTITNSTLSGNTATTGGALFVSSGILNASLNRIVSNTAATGSGIAQTGGTATVENNWWGCDGFPNAVGCQTGSGAFDANPRIDLLLTAAPATILTGGTSTLTADVSKNTDNATINPTVLNGLTITFAGTLGTVSPTTAPLAGLTATSTFTATSCGAATVSATLDNGTQSAALTINQAPVLSACPSNITTNTAAGQCSAVVTYTAPTATGCPTATVTCTPASGSAFAKGTTTVTCTATNGITPDASCSFTVTVNDNQTPVLTACPTNITTVENPPGSGGAAVTYTAPTATDNCPVTVTCVPPSGSTFVVGTTTVNCTASDGTNSVSCSFTVTVTAACTFTCPANIVVANSPGQCGANVSFAPTTTGSCGTVTCTPASGSFFAVGTTTVSCASSVGPSCSFTVTVNDTEAPMVTLNPSNLQLWPPNHNYHTVLVSSLVTSVTDNCDGSIPVSNVSIVRVSSDEPENGMDDGNTTNDIVIAADCKSVQLRAERQESGNGRVYTITLQVKDSRNNVRTVTKTVSVPISLSGTPAVLGPGPGYQVTSNCVMAPLAFRWR